MIDATWLPGVRGLFEYLKAAITNMLIHARLEEAEEIMSKDTSDNKPRAVTRRIGYPIAGLALLLVAGPLFVIGAYSIITSLMSL